MLRLNKTRDERENYLATRDYLEKNLIPARAPSAEITDEHRDLAASLQECLNNILIHVCGSFGRSTGLKKLAHGRGRCAELHGKRPSPALRAVRGYLRSARRRRRRHGPRRGAPDLGGKRRRLQRAHARADAWPCLRRKSRRGRAGKIRRQNQYEEVRLDGRDLRRRRRADRGGPRARVVSRADGIRPARARQPQHPRRSRPSRNARPHQRDGEKARGVSSLCARRLARGSRQAGSTSRPTPACPT